MAVHFLNTRALVSELSQDQLGEKDTMHYFLANSLLWTVVLYYEIFAGAHITWMFLSEIGVVLAITALGVLRAYEANGSEEGRCFLIRVICLSFPIGLKVNVISVLLSWAFYAVFPVLVDPVAFRNPDRVYDLITFVWAPLFTGIIYWRIWVHIMEISRRSAPNHAPQPTQ